MPANFFYEPNAGRVVFGAGRLETLGAEIGRLDLCRALVISTPAQRDLAVRASELLGKRCVGIFDRAVMHVPYEAVKACETIARELSADCTIAIGGGSTTGLAKALALEMKYPIIAVPTTYAGSEMTPIWGITRDQRKVTGRDRIVLPKTVIYDPELLVPLPPSVTGPSGINAIAHAVEALYSPDANPVTSLMAEEAIAKMATWLPRAVQDSADVQARTATLYAAWLSGSALGTVGMGLHHKICHVLGGTFDLPHADVHSIMLPYVVAFNASGAKEEISRVARALGGEEPNDAASLLFDLQRLTCPKNTLADLGLKEGDLDFAAELAAQGTYPNPRPISKLEIARMLEDAFSGRRPRYRTG